MDELVLATLAFDTLAFDPESRWDSALPYGKAHTVLHDQAGGQRTCARALFRFGYFGSDGRQL